jgi:hypothetical protein
MRAFIFSLLCIIYIELVVAFSASTKLINVPENFSYESANEAGIKVRIASTAKGLGAFATSHIPLGTLLGEYRGETLTPDEVKARFWGKRKPDSHDEAWINSREKRGQDTTGNYLLELPHGGFVDAEDQDVSTWCRFMNHADENSCNVMPFMQSEIGGKFHTWPRMYAIHDIEIGQELCWDYGEYFFIGNRIQE